jgi:hypothetical protein
MLIFAIILVNPYLCIAAKAESSKNVTQSFKKKVEHFKEFFSKMPKALSAQPFPKSPSGSVFSFYKYRMVDLSFDVQKSDSLISPFIGYIYLTYEEWDNNKCGDVSVSYPVSRETVYCGYSTDSKAKNNDNSECYQRSKLTGKSLRPEEEIKFIFAYQENRWVFKDVIRVEYNIPDIVISTALGKPVGPGRYREENKFWEELVK